MLYFISRLRRPRRCPAQARRCWWRWSAAAASGGGGRRTRRRGAQPQPAPDTQDTGTSMTTTRANRTRVTRLVTTIITAAGACSTSSVQRLITGEGHVTCDKCIVTRDRGHRDTRQGSCCTRCMANDVPLHIHVAGNNKKPTQRKFQHTA